MWVLLDVLLLLQILNLFFKLYYFVKSYLILSLVLPDSLLDTFLPLLLSFDRINQIPQLLLIVLDLRDTLQLSILLILDCPQAVHLKLELLVALVKVNQLAFKHIDLLLLNDAGLSEHILSLQPLDLGFAYV